MFALRFLMASLLLALALTFNPSRGQAAISECADLFITKDTFKDLMKRFNETGHPVAHRDSAEVVSLEIPLQPYLDRLNLEEPLSEAIPIRSTRDLTDSVTGKVDRSKIVRQPLGIYPVESFAIDSSATWVAMTFHEALFKTGTSESQKGALFISQINKDKHMLQHFASIPASHSGYAQDALFLKSPNKLIVHENRPEGESFAEDLSLYDLSGGSPRRIESLSERLGVTIHRITPVDSADPVQKLFVLQLVQPKGTRYADGTDLMIVSVDTETGEPKIILRAFVPSDLAVGLSSFNYEDERRGYASIQGSHLRLVNGYHDIIFKGDRLSRNDELPNSRSNRRSSFAAWLKIKNSNERLNSFTIENELTGERSEFTVPEIGYGSVTAVDGGYLFIQRNHPNYGQYMLDSRTGRSHLVNESRLIRQKIHKDFIAGTTDSKLSEPTIKVQRFDEQ